MDTPTTITLRPPVWALLLAVVIGGCFFVAGKNVEANRQMPQIAMISVTGEGKASAAPDIAELTFGFDSGNMPTAKAAMDALSKQMQSVMDAVKATGVAEKDIRTQSLWLSPISDYVNGRTVPRGFRVSQQLLVKVRDLDKASDVLAVATNAGANQVGGIDFRSDDPEILRSQAREAAIAQAKSKANMLAKDLGVTLVRLMSFSEDGASMPPIMYSGRSMMEKSDAMMAEPVMAPLPAGEQEVTAHVTLSYEIR